MSRVIPICVDPPPNPSPRNYTPPGGVQYKVKDGDSWITLARQHGMDAWALIRFNYLNLPQDTKTAARQVNWYLEQYVGCNVVTADGQNYCFSTSASPGIIFVPGSATSPTQPPAQPTQPQPPALNYWRYLICFPYMYGEMVNNARSPAVFQILALNNGGPLDKVAALTAWALLVRTGARWDHKPILRQRLSLVRGDRHFPIPGDPDHEWFYDIWSNIHYGYVGRAAGFRGFELQMGHQAGGIAGATDPVDIETVQLGIDLWDRYGYGLTPQLLHQGILSRKDTILQLQMTQAYIDSNGATFKHLTPITDGQ